MIIKISKIQRKKTKMFPLKRKSTWNCSELEKHWKCVETYISCQSIYFMVLLIIHQWNFVFLVHELQVHSLHTSSRIIGKDTKSIQKIEEKTHTQIERAIVAKDTICKWSMNYACVIESKKKNTHRHKHTHKEIETRIFISFQNTQNEQEWVGRLRNKWRKWG